ncbi:hypothetical protein [Novosphingobium sp. Leaf2]|uniref:hypothetical protein n=1 Tax=Novosphingobium sp. Leaf2 TaxID=1735670 RepID=UPI000AC010AD|nr:hypothetical protein [Novosphingobium sp. Leaf2]
MSEDLYRIRPFCDWHEDHGDVLWWRIPICESPYVGSPLDCGRDMLINVSIGFEHHALPIQQVGAGRSLRTIAATSSTPYPPSSQWQSRMRGCGRRWSAATKRFTNAPPC